MKKLMFIATLLLFIGSTTACAYNDKPIDAAQLPTKSQQFIKTHFPQESVSFASVDKEVTSKSYEVLLSDGTKIDFDKNGEWKEVDCNQSPVPASIIPAAIATYVAQNYPNSHIVQIDRDKRDYELELSNDVDLVFDLNGNFIRVDM